MDGFFTRLGRAGVFTLLCASCGAPPSGGSLTVAGESQGALADRAPHFQVCDTSDFSAAEPEGFYWRRNAARARGESYHSAQDAIGLPGSAIDTVGWFAYGLTRRGVSDENVALSIDRCGSWDKVGTGTTEGHGRVDLKIPSEERVGRFNVALELRGDGSYVTSQVHVLPAGTHLVLFDIDGTVTTDNEQFMREIMDDSYVPAAFTDAAAATRAWHDKGYVIVYLTGRPHAASYMTRDWLANEKFAPGHLHMTEYLADAMPRIDGVGEFKREYIKHLKDLGYIIDYAYGNEATDVYAYAHNDIGLDRIFTIGVDAGIYRSQALKKGYTGHLEFIASQPAAAQPYLINEPSADGQ